MSNNIDVVILGAGPPARGKLPSALKPISMNDKVIEWQMDCFKDCKKVDEIFFIGGYEFDKIVQQYPNLHFINNKEWEAGGALQSLLKLPFNDRDLMISYSDTLFRKDFINEIAKSESEITLTVDSVWKNRYEKRAKKDIEIAETLTINNRNQVEIVEFTGLMLLKKNVIKHLFQLETKDFGTTLIDLINYLNLKNFSCETYDVLGDWAELNAPEDLARFVIGTKAETLSRLDPMITKSKIGKQHYFRVEEWLKNERDIVDEIQKIFPYSKLIIRSSSKQEDSWNNSSAGIFDSIINVDSQNIKEIKNSVVSVIESYKRQGSNSLSEDQVLVQEYINEVDLSGVVFTCDLNTGAPYYKFNFDETGKTDTITSGSSVSDRTVIINRLNSEVLISDFQKLSPVLDAVKEIEDLLGFDKLDIEFAIDEESTVHIFQVRPIVVDHSEFEYNFEKFRETIELNLSFFNKKNDESNEKYGQNIVFSNMPDWNPAEIIGTKPFPLSFSLYRELITEKVWSIQRNEFGYKMVDESPLIISLSGQPYVDCSMSFNSFIPSDISDNLANKLTGAYLLILSNNPDLFDKVEFDVALTSWTPDFKIQAKERLCPIGISSQEISILENALKAITSSAITNLDKHIQNVNKLKRIRDKIFRSKMSQLQKINFLIEDCKKFGTLPFAHAARHGFIATAFLKSFVAMKIISDSRFQEFFNNVSTVATDFEIDISNNYMGNVTNQEMIEKYGHLRPGTYEISVEPYWRNPEKYLFGKKFMPQAQNKSFKFTSIEKDKIRNVLNELDSNIGMQEFMEYLTKSIQERERVKFEFTKILSLALDNILDWGLEKGINKDDIKFIEYKDLQDDSVTNDVDSIKKIIEKNKNSYIYTNIVQLPPLINKLENFYCFENSKLSPNFVTNKKTISRIEIDIDSSSTNLKDKIVMIERADPGFDWIFNQGISGLITKYGGANSHMAIRSAEIGIPAAIGVGEALFEKLKLFPRIELDCQNNIIRKA